MSQTVRFLTTIVLARLLVPEMFGLVAMATVTINLVAIARELGFGPAYIQRQFENDNAERVAANTTFFLNLSVNVVLFVLVASFTPHIVKFFQVQGSDNVLRALFVIFLLDGLTTTPTLVLRKRLQFGKIATAEILAAVANGALAIPLAASGFGVWSLVLGQIGARGIQGGTIYWLSGWRPKLEFDAQLARQLFAYGKYLWAFAALSALGGALDRLIIGRFLGPASLGIYGLAFNLCSLPATQISFLVNRIAFPAFARMQNDQATMRRALVKALSHVSILSLPVAFGMLSVAEEFVHVVYGEKWANAVPVIEILAFYGMVLSISSVTGPVFQAVGKPQVLFYTSLLHHGVLIILLLLLARYGIVGIAVAVVVPLIFSGVVAFTLVGSYLSLRMRELLSPVLLAGLASVFMLGAVESFQLSAYSMLEMTEVGVLCGSVVIGVVAYIGCTAIMNRAVLLEFAVTLRQVIVSKGELVGAPREPAA